MLKWLRQWIRQTRDNKCPMRCIYRSAYAKSGYRVYLGDNRAYYCRHAGHWTTGNYGCSGVDNFYTCGARCPDYKPLGWLRLLIRSLLETRKRRKPQEVIPVPDSMHN